MADASVAPHDRPHDRPRTSDQLRIEFILEKMKTERIGRPFRAHRGRVLPQHLWMTAGMALDAARTSIPDADVPTLELTRVIDPHWEAAYGEVVCSVFELKSSPWGHGSCNRVFRAWDAALELQHYAAADRETLSDEAKRDLDEVKALLVRAKEAGNTFFAGTRWRRPWAAGHDDF